MRAKTVALTLSALIASPSLADDTQGFTLDRSPHEYRITSFRRIDWFKGSMSLFHYEKDKTKLYGIGLGVGARVMKFKYIDTYISGTANGGIAVSPKVDPQPCPPAIIEPDPVRKIVHYENETEQKIRQKQADLEYEKDKNEVNWANQLARSNEANCNAGREAAAEYERYGGLLFYDVGLENMYKLGVFRINTFTGYRFEDKKNWNNTGDIKLQGLTYKIGIGFEW